MKESSRKRIVETAKELLLVMTVSQISMNTIADRLNLTAPTLYHYFTGKDELLSAAGAVLATEMEAPLKIKFPKSIKADIRLMTVGHVLIDTMIKKKVPGSYLIADPSDKPIRLGNFRSEFINLCRKVFNDEGKKGCQMLALLAVEIDLHQRTASAIPEDVIADFIKLLK